MESGLKLMMQVFNETSPIIKLTDLSNTVRKMNNMDTSLYFLAPF